MVTDMAKRLPPVNIGETVTISFDFSDDVDDFEGATFEVACELIEGMTGVAVPSPVDIRVGDPWMQAGIVRQQVSGNVSGAYYRLTATLHTATSPAEDLMLSAILPVRKS